MDINDLSTATMLVTGGNTGIGLETVVGLARTGAHVVFTSRDADRGREALAHALERSGSQSIEVMPLDLASLASIAQFADRFSQAHSRLDALVANAGVVGGAVRKKTIDGLELTFGVNHIGHMALIERLEPMLRASAPSRVVVVASGAYTVADAGICFDDLNHEDDYHSFRVYGESKLANIWYGMELSRRLADAGVTVNMLNPGLVTTELGKPRPGEEQPAAAPAPSRSVAEQALFDSLPKPVTAEIGARTSIKLATSPDLEGVTGSWWSAGRPAELNSLALDAGQAERLWTVSEEVLRLHEPG